MPQLLKVSAKFQEPLKFADFDKKSLKKGFKAIGKDLKTKARKLVSRKTLSKANEYPGRDSGVLRLSIGEKVSKSGFSVAIGHFPKGQKVATAFNKKGFYPAYVYYGHVAPFGANKSPKGKRSHKKNPGRKVAAPRANYIIDVVEKYASTKYPDDIRRILDNAIKPAFVGGRR